MLSPRMIAVIENLSNDWRRLDERIKQVTEEIEELAHGSENSAADDRSGHRPAHRQCDGCIHCRWSCFAKGRDFAAWLGLVPKQMSTGDRTILERIQTGKLGKA